MTVSEKTLKLLPWLVAVAFFMESLDTTILNTAVPIIANALGVAPLSMKAVLSSYTLSLAVFIPISSWIADRFGTRRVFSSAIGVFTLGSLLCGISNDIHVLVACRILQGCGGAMMVPVGRLTLVRAFPKSELVRAMTFVAIPALIGPMLGPLLGGVIVGLFNWRVIFFVNVPIGLAGLYLVHRFLPDYREPTDRIDFIGLVLFGAGIALFSYVLEVFGEHTLSLRETWSLLALAALLLTAYGVHARGLRAPLLNLKLMQIRTLRVAVLGNFITRLGVGGMPFLLPLLYQIGLGHSPVQSGLLIMPQSIAAICLRAAMSPILVRFGFKNILRYNTWALGLVIALFATIDTQTSEWTIVALACAFGFFSSLQYTSMGTLVYADVTPAQTSMASTIVSTMQQMSLSFGVAVASLLTEVFIPEGARAHGEEMVHGLHHAFVLLGALTVISSLVFRELKPGDGASVSLHREQAAEAH